jgi:adenylate cyclase, class 2
LKNLEYKARVRELNSLEKIFIENGAEFAGLLKQRDFYFDVKIGRLKLREAAGKKAELIFYERDEASSAGMESRYEIFTTTDPSLKDLLAKALGVKTIVEKDRRLLMMKNARIHLDEVKGLGSFLEFEVVSAGDDRGDSALLETLKTYAAPFVVKEIGESYSDLMLRGEAAKY